MTTFVTYALWTPPPFPNGATVKPANVQRDSLANESCTGEKKIDEIQSSDVVPRNGRRRQQQFVPQRQISCLSINEFTYKIGLGQQPKLKWCCYPLSSERRSYRRREECQLEWLCQRVASIISEFCASGACR